MVCSEGVYGARNSCAHSHRRHHRGTIDATERAAIAALFNAFAPLRYDRDAGPVRFVTLAQLAQAWR